MTLYEVDEDGWVHRQVQLHADGTRFSPEDILMCQPVMTDSMACHPAADEIIADDFEAMWREVRDDRPFTERIPDPYAPWVGRSEFQGQDFELAWAPRIEPAGDWTLVPGFARLYVRGDDDTARAVCAALFVESTIEWYAVRKAA